MCVFQGDGYVIATSAARTRDTRARTQLYAFKSKASTKDVLNRTEVRPLEDRKSTRLNSSH